MRRVAYYEHHTGRLSKPLTLAVVSDLHNEEYEDIFPLIQDADALLVPGDISDRYQQVYDRGLDFLTDAAKRLDFIEAAQYRDELLKLEEILKNK